MIPRLGDALGRSSLPAFVFSGFGEQEARPQGALVEPGRADFTKSLAKELSGPFIGERTAAAPARRASLTASIARLRREDLVSIRCDTWGLLLATWRAGQAGTNHQHLEYPGATAVCTPKPSKWWSRPKNRQVGGSVAYCAWWSCASHGASGACTQITRVRFRK